MKNIYILLVSLFFVSVISAQTGTTIDRVHLKIGKILEGKIIETKPGEYIIFMPSGKDADEIYIEQIDIIKIEQVEVDVKKKKQSKVSYSNFTYLSYINNMTTKDTTSRGGAYISNGILIQFNESFGLDLGVVLGITKGSRVTSIPILFNLKLNKTFSEKLIGFYYLEAGPQVASYKNNYQNNSYSLWGTGIGVKYKKNNNFSFFGSIGATQEWLGTPRIYNYFVNNELYRSDRKIESNGISNLQINLGINF